MWKRKNTRKREANQDIYFGEFSYVGITKKSQIMYKICIQHVGDIHEWGDEMTAYLWKRECRTCNLCDTGIVHMSYTQMLTENMLRQITTI